MSADRKSARLLIVLLAALCLRALAQSVAEPDVPPGLLERKNGKITNAPPEDFALAKTYHSFTNKGRLVGGQRITILTHKTKVKVGEPVRVLHILEAVEKDKTVYVMGPKTIYDEYVDGELRTPKGPGSEGYFGAVVNRPIADFNYEITSYRFYEPGRHTIQWMGGGHRIQTPAGLQSNVIQLEVVKE